MTSRTRGCVMQRHEGRPYEPCHRTPWSGSAVAGARFLLPVREGHQARPVLSRAGACLSGAMMHAAIRGAVAGVAATIPMTMVILGMRALGLIGTPPPKQITANAAATVGLHDDVPEPHFSAVWLIAHLGYGAACGMVYALLRPHLPVPYTVTGLAVGEAIWSVSYLGLL